MKKYLLFLFLLFLKQSFAQSPALPKIVPPSPGPSSLAKYADVPVSNYTGVPNISIPLIEVKSGKIALPISASYHSSGIKVAEEASWIGLGWALNAGGMITRQTRGLDDFKQQGGYIRTQLPPATDKNQPDWSDPTKPLPNTGNLDKYINTYYSSIESRFLDPEPDIFYYNFLQYSGKLVFEKQSGEIVKAVSIDQNNLTFVYDISAKVWTVTDGNGWKYYLGSQNLNAVETTTSYTLSDANPITPSNDRISHGDPDIFDSAWYLTKVITPEGDYVDFIYETQGKTVSQLSRSEEISDYLESKDVLNGQYAYRYVFPNARRKTYSVSQQVTNPVYLKKIVFINGYVDFITEDRVDIRSNLSTDPKAKRLKTMQLLNLKGNLIKQYNFNYSYFSSLPSGSGIPIVDNEERKIRLRLDSFQESANANKGSQIIKVPPYIFSYNQTLLPEKTSYSIDYWGYSNGRNNSSIIDYQYRDFNLTDRLILNKPSTAATLQALVPFYEGVGTNNIFYTGANREVDFNAAQAGILQKIQYPGGASVDFNYESNDYFSDKETLYEDEPKTESAKIQGNSTTKTSEKVFTLDKLTMVQLSFEVYNLMGSGITDQMTAALEDQSGKQLIAIAPWLELDANKGSFNHYLTVFLPAGSYKLKVSNNTTAPVNMEATIRYVKKNVTRRKIGAGLRIQSITTNDLSAAVKKKVYSYQNNNISTGQLVSPYHFFYNTEILTNGFSGGYYSSLLFQQINKYVVRCSESAVPFGNSAQGSVIGYNEVQVSDVDAGLNSNVLGSSKYFYRNIKEIPVESFIPGMPNVINLSNGQLLKEQQLNKNNDVVREKSTEYVLENTVKKIKGVKLYSNNESSNTDIRFYDVFSEWWHPLSDSETTYDLVGMNPVTTVVTYKYDNPLHKNLTETQTKDSKGQIIRTVAKYPSDLIAGIDDTPSSVISGMIGSNVINNVLKSETIIDNVTVQSSINNYSVKTHIMGNTSNNMYLPSNVRIFKKGTLSDYEEVLQYSTYNNNGNILQTKKTNGAPVAYIWGYGNEYVIAKVENIAYSNIPSNLITAVQNASDTGTEAELQLALSNLRNAPELSGAMISTYTYIPLVGVISITDSKGISTYYEYDSLGRLSSVKDQNLNVMQQYCYGYKGQQVDCSSENPYAEVFKSVARSNSFTKSDCASGGIGSIISFAQPAGAATSTVSQADADAKALVIFNTNGQANANTNGICSYISIARSGSFTRNNCASGSVASSVTYNQPAGAATSTVSQADADAKSLVLFNTNGQIYANSTAVCTFNSIARSGSFTKNNCASGGVGSSVAFNQVAGSVSSTVSQADADDKGLMLFNTTGQANANSNGTCTFSSIPRNASFIKNDCASGGVGSSVPFSQIAGVVSSTVSQADADAKGVALFNTNGQANANASGTCTFSSIARSGSFRKNNCASGSVASSVTYSQPAAAVTSTISQADADSKGLSLFNTNGQANANASGTCTYSSPAESGTFTKGGCPSGAVGSSVVYNQAAGAVISTISQADADKLGNDKFVSAGRQYASYMGVCNYSSISYSGTFYKQNCPEGQYGSAVAYSQAAGAAISSISQSAADEAGLAKFNVDGLANANLNGSCTQMITYQYAWSASIKTLLIVAKAVSNSTGYTLRFNITFLDGYGIEPQVVELSMGPGVLSKSTPYKLPAPVQSVQLVTICKN